VLKGIVFLFNFGIMLSSYAQFSIITPIEGTVLKDYFIVNHVDHDTIKSSISDIRCGKRTYDGHMGTDYVIPSFKAMDVGVNVLAAADGKVIYIVQDLFDREKGGEPSKTYGNIIIIEHADSFYTYYAHLKTNSALVNLGQSVKAGEIIAQVGSSGYATDPHLHFEMYHKDTLLDPYSGDCDFFKSNYNSDSFEYDTTRGTIASGLIPFNASIDTIREHLPPTTLFDKNDTAITYWIQRWGMRKGDKAEVKWFNPDSTLWFNFSTIIPEDYYYYYWYSWINNPISEPGQWRAHFYLNDELIDVIGFEVKPTSSVKSKYALPKGLKLFYNQSSSSLIVSKPELITHLSVYDASGRELMNSDHIKSVIPLPFKPGNYFVNFLVNSKNHIYKFIVSE
jgi:murein DD-endopeptidase